MSFIFPTFCSAVTLLNGAAVALLRAAASGAAPERALDVISTCAGLSGHGTDRTSNFCIYYYLQYFFLLSVVTVLLLTGTSGALLRAAPRGSAAGECNEAARKISCPPMPAFYFPPRLAISLGRTFFISYDIFHGTFKVTFMFQAGAVGHFLRG